MDINLTGGELLNQAHMTAHDYLIYAIDTLDKCLGKGTAAKHPELAVELAKLAAYDFNTSLNKQGAQDIRDGLHEIAQALQGRGY